MGSVIWEGDLTTMELGDHLLQPYPPHLGPSGDGQLKLTYQVMAKAHLLSSTTCCTIATQGSPVLLL